jgi:hypothetical protein
MKFLGQLSNYQLLKEDFVPCSLGLKECKYVEIDIPLLQMRDIRRAAVEV